MFAQNAHNGLTFLATKAGLTGISGAATTYSTGATALQYAVQGKAYSKAQVSGGATPTTDGRTGLPIDLVANKGTVVVWGVDTAGTVKVFQGSEEDLDAAGNFKFPPQLPVIPDNVCPFAYTIHKAASNLSGTWTFGASNWNVAGMSHAVQDVLLLPDRPQIS